MNTRLKMAISDLLALGTRILELDVITKTFTQKMRLLDKNIFIFPFRTLSYSASALV